MVDLAISVEGIGKRYRIGAARPVAASRSEAVRRMLASPFAYLGTTVRAATDEETHWALRDVSFNVKQGEIVGIIGRNGAGKSTLLKILSRITEPTEGRAVIKGRLGSLLEVGAGFHPELTGRENVFLNGAVLGMHRSEILARFDEIVEFSGVDRFIDTPVKRYSSGMYVRLAFAVAAHLEPEVLIVDEVLAVGDAEFQRRCLGKMESIGQEGRTVLLVSHSMPTITRFCQRAVLLHAGGLVEDGDTGTVVSRYLQSGYGLGATREWLDAASAPGNNAVRIRALRAIREDGTTPEAVDIREPVGIQMEIEIEEPVRFVPWLALYSDHGGHIFSAFDTDPTWRTPRPPGRYVSTAWIPGNLLNEGSVIVSASLNTFSAGGKAEVQARADEAIAFQVIDPGDGLTSRGDYAGTWTAPVRPLLDWSTSTTGDRLLEGRP